MKSNGEIPFMDRFKCVMKCTHCACLGSYGKYGRASSYPGQSNEGCHRNTGCRIPRQRMYGECLGDDDLPNTCLGARAVSKSASHCCDPCYNSDGSCISLIHSYLVCPGGLGPDTTRNVELSVTPNHIHFDGERP